jgi:thioredoxin-related protein
VLLAHQIALESPLMHAEVIEANEFIDLATRYNVRSVTQITIDDGKGTVLGAVPGSYLLQEIKHAFDNNPCNYYIYQT